MIFAVPADRPVTTPVLAPMVMIPVEPALLHVPPVVALFNVVVVPVHTVSVPVMPVDNEVFTVTIFVTVVLPQLLLTV